MNFIMYDFFSKDGETDMLLIDRGVIQLLDESGKILHLMWLFFFRFLFAYIVFFALNKNEVPPLCLWHL